MKQLLIVPINFKHKAGDGIVTRQHKLSDLSPALQSNCGETQCTYVLEIEGEENDTTTN